MPSYDGSAWGSLLVHPAHTHIHFCQKYTVGLAPRVLVSGQRLLDTALRILVSGQRLLDTALRILVSDQRLLDTALRVWVSGRRLLDTALRIWGHWVFCEGSARRLNQVSKSPNALATARRVLVSSWGLLKNTVEEKYWAHILYTHEGDLSV